jgi:hypothetical protein
MNPLLSSKNERWFTPQDIIEKSRDVLGGIDLDPASELEANEKVLAKRIITKEECGLLAPWRCEGLNIFLNPPSGKLFGKSLPLLFWNRLMQEAPEFNHAIFIIFSLNQLQSFQQRTMNPLCFPICFAKKRLHFELPTDILSKTGKKDSPTHANAIVYIPGRVDNTDKFMNIFSEVGCCKL